MAEPTPDAQHQDEELGPPTAPMGRAAPTPLEMPDRASTVRLFGSHAFFRLWVAQVVSALGDWIGFVAVAAIAARIGGSSPEAAVGVVLSARLVPGFFLAPAAGVLVDRWDRKRVMVLCDIGRGLVMATLPFVDTIAGLFFVSLLLEVLTLMWSPAKEASVPNLVRPEFLANANSLSLVAAYGTFPVASALFAGLAKVAERLGEYDALDALRVSQESIAIYVDVGTFFVSALLIATLALPRPERVRSSRRFDFRQTFRELAEGWRFIGQNAVVRSVIVGLATGLIGGGMVVPLGTVMSTEVFGAGPAGFGLLLTALGTGVAVGIVGLSLVQKRLPHETVFVGALVGAGICIIGGASMSSITPALAFVAVLGLCAGAVYILGFTLLQTNVENELRGRIFATLYTLVRFCLLAAFAIAPMLSSLLDRLSDDVEGARLTLWFGGAIILMAALLARVSLRARQPS
ncbi:MAG: MFS transporter [Actinobacteria bacterium]|nr:MFS transporter [Actinomycetota bacterium]